MIQYRAWAESIGSARYNAAVQTGLHRPVLSWDGFTRLEIPCFANEAGDLVALELESGRQSWFFRTGGAIRAAPVAADGQVIAGSWDGHLYAVTTEGGLAWKADLAPARPGALAVGHGRVVFFDTATGDVRAVTATQEADAWRIDVLWSLPTGRRAGIWMAPAPGVLCVTSRDDDRVRCVDAASGAPRWTAAPGRSPLAPLLTGAELVVPSRDGRISAFDLESGAERWRVETAIPLTSEPTLSHGVLYVGGRDRAVYALVQPVPDRSPPNWVHCRAPGNRIAPRQV